MYPVQCKFCDKQGNITVVPGRDKPYTLEDSESGKFVPIGCFDCRGIEAVEFSFRDGWAAEGVSTNTVSSSLLCVDNRAFEDTGSRTRCIDID